jgi:uncharacterized membrane protein YfhO
MSKVKKEIKAKLVGRNVILIINGETHSKAFKTKVERADIVTKVEAYNKRNSITKEKELLKLMFKESSTTKAKKAKETTAKAKTTAKDKAKTTKTKATKTLSKEAQIKAARKLLEAEGLVITSKEAPKSKKRNGRPEY